MSSYKISVKTGDKKGAGLDANVYIILHGKGTKTDSYNLDTFFKNDFEAGTIDDYSVTSAINIPEVQRIELNQKSIDIYYTILTWNHKIKKQKIPQLSGHFLHSIPKS